MAPRSTLPTSPGLGTSKPAVDQNIAVDAVPAYSLHGFYTYLVSAFPAHATSFSPNFSKSSTVECELSSGTGIRACHIVGMHFVSP